MINYKTAAQRLGGCFLYIYNPIYSNTKPDFIRTAFL